MELLKLFNNIIDFYGQTAATIIITIIILVYSVYLIMKSYSSLIKKHFENEAMELAVIGEKVYTKMSKEPKLILQTVKENMDSNGKVVFTQSELDFLKDLYLNLFLPEKKK